MYTLTRKLSMVSLAVVLSVLAYGCGGGSGGQALITDVSTDMVTGGLTPDVGTYTIQPGGTANSGDVTFACLEEGSSCEVTVADDGTVTSTGGMATAMISASAEARLDADQRATEAETAKMLADQRATEAETAKMLADQRATEAETAKMLADQRATEAETAKMLADQRATEAETAKMLADQRATEAETAKMLAEDMRDAEETDRMAADQRVTEAETAKMLADQRATEAETAKMLADQRATEAETAKMLADQRTTEAETAKMLADQRATEAETAKMLAEDMRDTADAIAIAAVARAELLRKVKIFFVGEVPGYTNVTAGTYEIAAGASNTAPGDDITFTCPAEGEACVVVVAVDETTDVRKISYVSLGGEATGTSSLSAANTRAAICTPQQWFHGRRSRNR